LARVFYAVWLVEGHIREFGGDKQHAMSEPEPIPTSTPPPPTPPFQFSLRALLLLCVVLGSSLAVFGAWGIVVFGLVVGLAVYFHQTKSLGLWGCSALVLLGLGCLVALLVSAVKNTREVGLRERCAARLHNLSLTLESYYATLAPAEK
jgi:hypothetical protein